MSVVLGASNSRSFAPRTGLLAGLLVAAFITFEAPLSGMSMNPARTFGSALPAMEWRGLWIYFTAPPLGMLLAAELRLRSGRLREVRCAKLHHDSRFPCIFRCGYRMTADSVPRKESREAIEAREAERLRRPGASLGAPRLGAALLAAGILAPRAGAHAATAPVQASATESARAAAAAPLHGAAAPLPAAAVSAVDSIGITVSDLDRSLAFYSHVLGFEKLSETETAGEEIERLEGVFGTRLRVARLKLGDESIELREFLSPRGRPLPADSRSNDRWFQHIAIIVADMDRAYRWLRQNKVEHASSGPQRLPDWNPSAGGIEAFYFKDPDGHPLEVLHFPPGKGAEKWHRMPPASHPSSPRAPPGAAGPDGKGPLFLGIDHTAIVVGDTETSLGLYRDLLGMRVAGESENYGPEQERLNNVFGARLRITALRAASGPGIEFLEYLSPRDGRPAPSELRSNDLARWRTRLVTSDVSGVARQILARRAPLISPGAVALPAGETPFLRGLVFLDPDGHALELVEK